MGSRRSTSMEKSQGRWRWRKSTPARRTWIRMIQDDDHFTILLAIGLAKYLLRDRPMGLEDDNWEFEDQLKDWSTEKLQTDLKKTMDEVEKTHNSMVATADEKRKTKKQLYGDAGRKVAKRLFSENDYRNVQYDRYTAQDNRRVYVIIRPCWCSVPCVPGGCCSGESSTTLVMLHPCLQRTYLVWPSWIWTIHSDENE